MDDTDCDGTQGITITASAPNYTWGIANVQVTDDDLPGGAAAIHGNMWNDLDGDGFRDAGEPGLAGWKVYVDTNQNGQWDTGEAYAITDANGDYTIDGLGPGAHVLSEEMQPGWQQTSPGYAWKTYGGHYYAATSQRASWAQSESEAVAAGGHLVTVNDADAERLVDQ